MKDKEILKKVAEKAIKNGWDGMVRNSLYPETKAHYFVQPYEVMIFDPDFAKAFWGEQTEMRYTAAGSSSRENEGWQYHLQRMVLEENPIQYLKEFI